MESAEYILLNRNTQISYYTNSKNELESFNISKAIDFCVDMFDTKRKYDKAKKNLQIYSDINFSYDNDLAFYCILL